MSDVHDKETRNQSQGFPCLHFVDSGPGKQRVLNTHFFKVNESAPYKVSLPSTRLKSKSWTYLILKSATISQGAKRNDILLFSIL